jgi:hypothetical protein
MSISAVTEEQNVDELLEVLEASESEGVETPEETVFRFEVQEIVRRAILDLDFRSWYVIVRRFGMYGMREKLLMCRRRG